MNILNKQLEELTQSSILSNILNIADYFFKQINEKLLFYDNEEPLLIYLEEKINEAFGLGFLNEAGVVKYIFMNLLVGKNNIESSDVLSLKKMVKDEKKQIRKNEIIDDYVFKITGFGELWRS